MVEKLEPHQVLLEPSGTMDVSMTAVISERPVIIYLRDLTHMSLNITTLCHVGRIFMRILLVVNFKIP